MTTDYRVIENEEQPVLEAGPGSRSRVLAARSNGTTCMAVVERWLEPGAEVPLHRHPEETEEVIWVISGRGEFEVDGERVVVGADTTVVIPPTSFHAFRTVGEETLYLYSRYSAAVPVMLTDDGAEGESEVPGT